MATIDKRVDDYIDKAKPFAQPILIHLRNLVHKACPGVEETMKWSFPHFDYKGEMMCSMASFKEHAVFGFWKAAIMDDPDGILGDTESAMGHFGKLKTLKDIPPSKVMIKYIKQAVKLNDEGVKLPSRKKVPTKEQAVVEAPPALLRALKQNKKANKTWMAFSNSCRKEYIEWITEAKTEATREKRLGTTLEWLEEGKERNWKYK